MNHADTMLRELNHRVKNNLQIIVSLMNLKSRMLPPERREDIRFLQEHVQSMAVAYRLVYDSGEMAEVPVGALLREVVAELRQIARLDPGNVRMVGDAIEEMMGLDQAISFGLFLAVLLPGYFDHARECGGRVTVATSETSRMVTCAVAGSWGTSIEFDPLRLQLRAAYIGQLKADVLPSADPSELRLRFALDSNRPNVSRSILERL